MLCPVVQAADATVWDAGRTRYVLAETVLPKEPDEPEPAGDLARSYLRAFGPATAADLTAWSGLPNVAPVLRSLDGVEVRSEGRQEIFDLPGRFCVTRPSFVLPEFDNVFFCRRRPDPRTLEAKRRLLPNPVGVMRGALVSGGAVRAAWWRDAGSDDLQLEPWEPLAATAHEEFESFRVWYAATSQWASSIRDGR